MIEPKDQGESRGYLLQLAALLVFASSRVIMLIAMAFANGFLPYEPTANKWEATSRWYRFLLRYDSGWYLHIANHGYSYDGNDSVQQTVVFYPLYPALIKALTYLGLSTAAAAVVISNVAIVAALVVFARLVSELFDRRTALLSVAFLSFYPGSMFFSAAFTESLAFLFIVLFFLFLTRGRFVMAACFAGLCFATRSTGLVLLAPLAWEIVARYWRSDRRRMFLEGAVCFVIATSGLWIYMIYLWAKFRAPFAFMTALGGWNTGNEFGNPWLLKPLIKAAIDLRHHIEYGIADTNSFSALMFVTFVTLLIIFRKRLSPSLMLYSAGVLLLPYFTRTGGVGFVSFNRYVMLAFPVFIVAAIFCRRRLWLALMICSVSAALLFWHMALFAKWYWVG